MPPALIRTARLSLRPGRSGDIKALVAAMADRVVVEQLSSVPWPYTRADAERFIAGMTRDAMPRYLIFQSGADGEALVGGCGVTRGGEQLKIGYWVKREVWGQGVATEAVAALLDTLRALGYDRVFAEHKPENLASARVLEKLGFAVCEGEPLVDKSHPALVLRVKHF